MSRRGWVLFGLMSVIWGVPYLLIKIADGGVSVPVLVFARVAVGACLLLPLAAHRRQLSMLRGHWRWLAVFACVEIIVPWALLSDAERRLTSSMSGLLVAAVPIIGVVLARVTGGRERLTPGRWLGLAVGLAGVAVLAGPGALRGDGWSVTEVMLTAVGYASGPLVASRRLAGLPGLAVTAVCLGLATVVYAPAAALSWPAAAPAASVLAALAALGVVCTATAFVLFFQLIAEAGPVRATVITYVNPAVAVAGGVAVLGEPLSGPIVAAFALILTGSVLATRSGSRRRPRSRPPRSRPAAVTAGGGAGAAADGTAGGAMPR